MEIEYFDTASFWVLWIPALRAGMTATGRFVCNAMRISVTPRLQTSHGAPENSMRSALAIARDARIREMPQR